MADRLRAAGSFRLWSLTEIGLVIEHAAKNDETIAQLLNALPEAQGVKQRTAGAVKSQRRSLGIDHG